jgi:hypothetical protein
LVCRLLLARWWPPGPLLALLYQCLLLPHKCRRRHQYSRLHVRGRCVPSATAWLFGHTRCYMLQPALSQGAASDTCCSTACFWVHPLLQPASRFTKCYSQLAAASGCTRCCRLVQGATDWFRRTRCYSQLHQAPGAADCTWHLHTTYLMCALECCLLAFIANPSKSGCDTWGSIMAFAATMIDVWLLSCLLVCRLRLDR